MQSVSNISVNNSKVQEPTLATSLGVTTVEAEVEGEPNLIDPEVH